MNLFYDDFNKNDMFYLIIPSFPQVKIINLQISLFFLISITNIFFQKTSSHLISRSCLDPTGFPWNFKKLLTGFVVIFTKFSSFVIF